MRALFQHHAGEIPPSLGKLRSLQTLNLSFNGLSGESLKQINVCGSTGDIQTPESIADSCLVDVLWDGVATS